MILNLLYISISGNSRSFAKRIQQLSEVKHEENSDCPLIHIKEIHDNVKIEEETSPYVVVVPTYLEGGNGLDSGDQEIMTESLRDYLDSQENHQLCLGIIGSGNKNFAHQYCLTAKQYAQQFDVPMIADFELRGNPKEIEKIYTILCDICQNYEAKD
ncbi:MULTISPECIES: class Ib ribonucleoside-diphosphate reductase assembly flavoprotein NrdI [Enterococcus]|uniref:Ribonucleotide reductase assembly protein NrdI n=1 Tax=Enterococcus alcedinis TaxID=1274384 RepID=A0A917N4H6_9ENTE|nr:class Ib ribonucleoside-diphosphate reductase assembly flavoprotein NrdI [Enterococcus alcedinis]MBP2101918.1 protein involved in ribonucleotide reduction [Enterococcus alcedinis]GGI65481.1 ribonucleotide reductase assembly protein NrdI [Enterococcus alcedinis]